MFRGAEVRGSEVRSSEVRSSGFRSSEFGGLRFELQKTQRRIRDNGAISAMSKNLILKNWPESARPERDSALHLSPAWQEQNALPS